MRLGLFLTTLIGLAGASHISSAADATWAAVSDAGTMPSCAGPNYARVSWQVDIKRNTLTFTNGVTSLSFTVDLKGLQPDGSGRVAGKDEYRTEFYVTFYPGSGARPFYVTSSTSPCRSDFTPKT
jgi:hypothetical protein